MPKTLYRGLQIINLCHFISEDAEGTSRMGNTSVFNYNYEINRLVYKQKIYARIKYHKQFARVMVPRCGYWEVFENVLFDSVRIFPKKYRKYFKIAAVCQKAEGKLVLEEIKQ